ncbi:MAG: paraquat-inducible protein A [Candidatus Omnitrophota bacterium]
MNKSLHNIYSIRIDVYLLWCIAAVTLIAGLTLPVITFTELIVKTSTFSILGGVKDLFKQGEHVLGLVIFIFSIAFPIIKLTTLLYLWFAEIKKVDRSSHLDKLGNLGKWSMLDVYVLAMTIVIAKSSAFMKAEPRMGIYFFGTSVMVSMLASMKIGSLSKRALKR